MHSRSSLNCLPVVFPLLFFGIPGRFCHGGFLVPCFSMKFTGSCIPSPSIFFSCSLVASLILRDSMAFFRSQLFSLNNLVLAALSLQPSTNRSRTISSSRVPNWQGSESWRSLIKYWSIVSCVCCSVVRTVYF